VEFELGGEGAEGGSEGVEIEAVESPFHAHEEEAGLGVLMLVGMGNVGAVSVEEASHGCD
jgi:hypothetical protein